MSNGNPKRGQDSSKRCCRGRHFSESRDESFSDILLVILVRAQVRLVSPHNTTTHTYTQRRPKNGCKDGGILASTPWKPWSKRSIQEILWRRSRAPRRPRRRRQFVGTLPSPIICRCFLVSFHFSSFS